MAAKADPLIQHFVSLTSYSFPKLLIVSVTVAIYTFQIVIQPHINALTVRLSDVVCLSSDMF